MFPADGQHPMFLWWYTPQNDTVYNVHYKGLIEYYLPPKATHFTRRNTTDIDTLARTFLAEQNALQRRFRNLHQMRTRGLGMNGTFPRLGRLVGRLARGDIEEAIEIIEDLQEQADEIAREAEAAGEEDLHNQAQHVLNNLTMLEKKNWRTWKKTTVLRQSSTISSKA
ncbi:MAG: hypothetical protein GWN86_18530 [Desulfobacterales bacterium]|nr:hypothetical protein [Desulfobacterales bacterium]